MLCLFQSPQSRADKFSAAGQAYFKQANKEGLQSDSQSYLLSLARKTFLQSVRLKSGNAKDWRALAEIFTREGNFDAARQAEVIATYLSGERPEKEPSSDIRLARAKVFSWDAP